MPDEPRTEPTLRDDELEAQEAEALPDRETMTIVDLELTPPAPEYPIESSVEDDRYEQ